MNRIAPLLLLLLAFAAPARASYVYISEQGTGSGQNVSLTLPVGTNSWFAGFQTIAISPSSSGTPATDYSVFCVDPAHFASSSFLRYIAPAGDNLAAVLGAARAVNIENLYNLYYAGTIGSNANAAAFQIALWELAYDDGNLSTGAVQKTGSTGASMVSAVNALLGNLSYSGSNLYAFSLYQADRSVDGSSGQDYALVVSQAPVPAPLVLALSGLGLIGGFARRRKQRA
jgi:hypothetical protein